MAFALSAFGSIFANAIMLGVCGSSPFSFFMCTEAEGTLGVNETSNSLS